MSTPLHVTAALDNAACGVEGNPLPLDGLLAWSKHAQEKDPTPTIRKIKDVQLPVEKWHSCGTWGWKTSRAHPHIIAHTRIQLRRKPPDFPLSVYAKDKKNHHGLDAWKARDITVPAVLIDTIEWDIVATDEKLVWELLQSITHIGSHRAYGCGHVVKWSLSPGEPEAWKDRPMPQPGVTGRFRPPYWSAERQVSC